MKPKLYVFDNVGYADPFLPLFDLNILKFPNDVNVIKEQIQKSDAVLFTGGGDVDPALYGEKVGKYTSPDVGRTKYENVIMSLAIDSKKKILGICRGAQLACVKAGGRLVQHVDYHGQDHFVKDARKEEDVYAMSSLHHQMMLPQDKNGHAIPHILLAYSEHEARTYLNGDDKPIDKTFDVDKEPDIVWFPEIQALGFQGHPEMMDPNDKEEGESLRWIRDLTKEFIY